ncbi:MAG TPA: hypothetical protein DCZ72_02550 [Armatimonadetes bacterium]|nr:hypothetical protein [Armatimonadota bacterium]
MSHRPTARRLAPALLIALLLTACGSSNVRTTPTGPTTGPQSPTSPTAKRPVGTALFEVDLKSRKVTVTPLDGDATNRAVFNGSAIKFEAGAVEVLPDEQASIGVRVTNQFGAPIGRDYLRVLLNAAGPEDDNDGTDAQRQVAVSTDPLGMSGLRGLTFGRDGAYVVTRFSTNRLYLVENGHASVFAGQGSAGFADGNAGVARFNRPTDVIYHAGQDAFFVTDTGNHRIRRIDRNGTVNTIAGTYKPGSTDGLGHVATFNAPQFIDVDPDGSLVVTTGDGAVRRITHTGGAQTASVHYMVSTVASGLTTPAGIAVGADRTIYVAEQSAHRIRALGTNGENVVIAGTGAPGTADGAGDVATLRRPVGLGWARDSLVVADSGGNSVRWLFLREGASPWSASSWRVLRIAGSQYHFGTGSDDGQGINARFNTPWGLRARADGTVILTDVQNSSVRRLGLPPSTQKVLPTISSWGWMWFQNPTGSYQAYGGSQPYYDFDLPQGSLAPGATTDEASWVFSTEEGVDTYRFTATVEGPPSGKVSPEGGHGENSNTLRMQTVILSVRLASLRDEGSIERDGIPGFATINDDTRGLAVDPDEAVYLASPHAVRRYDPRTNTITTIAGHLTEAGRATGDGTTARFTDLTGIAAPRPGVVYVADKAHHGVYALINTSGDRNNPSDWHVTQAIGNNMAGVPGGYNPRGVTGPRGIGSTSAHSVWIIDSGNRVLLASCATENFGDPDHWSVAVAAGSRDTVETGDTDDPVRFNNPMAVAVGVDRAAYVVDTGNHKIRRVRDGLGVSTFSGPAPGTVTPGYADGAASSALYTNPIGIASDTAGYLYVVTDDGVRRVSPTGTATTILRSGDYGDWDAASGSTAQTSVLPATTVRGIAVAPGGDLWYVDAAGLRRLSRIVGTGSP